MRELIRISDSDLQQLQKFCDVYPEMYSQIQRAIEFRKQVLKIFDGLAGSVATQPQKGINAPTCEGIAETSQRPFTGKKSEAWRICSRPEQYAIEMQKASR